VKDGPSGTLQVSITAVPVRYLRFGFLVEVVTVQFNRDHHRPVGMGNDKIESVLAIPGSDFFLGP
jgi:hypothetical protein